MSDREPSLGHVATTVRGRYWIRRAIEGSGRGTLIGFHGYGEDSERLLAEIERIPEIDRWTVGAVQALHPFYTRSGRVVASWMTKLDREMAIEDNLAYVATAIDQIDATAALPRPWVYLGFSQGTAMAYRAAIASRRPADAIIALAGDVPAELASSERSFPPTLIGRGSEDTWYTAEKEVADRSLLEERGAAVEVFGFDGGHEWTDPFRDACARFLAERAA